MMAPPCKGWVYILTNPAFPNLCKIGCTSRTPDDRARELSSATGVPARYVVAWACPVTDWQGVERLTHDRLARCRANRNREFFRCTVPEARREIERAAHAYLRPRWMRAVIGPPLRSARAGYGGARRHGTASGHVLALLVALLLVVAVARPAIPAWMPAGSLVRSIIWIKLHAHRHR